MSSQISWPYFLRVRSIVKWPVEYTSPRVVSSFRAGFGATVTLLEKELEHLSKPGQRSAVLQMAYREQDLRVDGYPKANARMDHPGVILSIESIHGPLSYPCDTYDDWQDNLRAIALTLQNLRAVTRYGVLKLGEHYTGSRQLGAGPTMTQREAAELLVKTAHPDGELSTDGVSGWVRGVLTDPDVRATVWRRVLKAVHHNGVVTDRELWERLNEAKRLVS